MASLIPRAAARDVINTWGRQKSEKIRMGLLHRDLDAIPTVDAIPVEWLREKMNWADDEGDLDSVDLFSWIIQTWQKEQEGQRELEV